MKITGEWSYDPNRQGACGDCGESFTDGARISPDGKAVLCPECYYFARSASFTPPPPGAQPTASGAAAQPASPALPPAPNDLIVEWSNGDYTLLTIQQGGPPFGTYLHMHIDDVLKLASLISDRMDDALAAAEARARHEKGEDAPAE